MLYMPQNAPTTGTIIGIDPGSSKLGFCIMTVDVVTLEIVSTDAFTIIGEKLMSKTSFLEMIHGARFARIDALEDRLYTLFVKHNPFDVASESPFFNPSRPNAFEVLVEVLFMIRKALWRFDPWVRLYRIDPPTVKLGVGVVLKKAVKGSDTKTPVGDRVIAMEPELNYIGKTKLAKLDDNARDAIAVAYTRLQILRGRLCHKPRQ